ncbi:MAG: efflux RND transporter periplasmic adaptor subunit [Winogradskyella arenosi]
MKVFLYSCSLFLIVACTNQRDNIQPKIQTLTASVYASAMVQPDSMYQVYAVVSGILDQVFVEEGDVVVKDQPLIQITNKTSKLNNDNAQYALELAKDNYSGNAAVLSSLEEDIAMAQLQYKNDSISFFRQKNLWEKHIGSQQDYDTKKLRYELALSSLKSMENNYNSKKNALQVALKQAQIHYNTTVVTTNDFLVKSKMDGKVYALFKEPGEIVTTAAPIAAIGSVNQFVIQLLVDEVDIVQIAPQQDVLMTLEAYADRVFKGEVSKIYPKKDERNQTFIVEAVFDQAPKILYPGLSGEANIIISQKKNVLTIPKAYLRADNTVETDAGIVEVETGMQNLEAVEILSGLTKGTTVYKPEP